MGVGFVGVGGFDGVWYCRFCFVVFGIVDFVLWWLMMFGLFGWRLLLWKW